jgi:hypothetical protein
MNHWSDELAAWWDDVRHWMAFSIAPLAVPFIMVVTIAFDGASQSEISLIALFSLLLGYIGTLVFGLPLYLLLRAYGHTDFWLAPIIGFIAGLAMMYLVHSWLAVVPLAIAGPSGAVVGALLWLIGRPDRQRRSTSDT